MSRKERIALLERYENGENGTSPPVQQAVRGMERRSPRAGASPRGASLNRSALDSGDHDSRRADDGLEGSGSAGGSRLPRRRQQNCEDVPRETPSPASESLASGASRESSGGIATLSAGQRRRRESERPVESVLEAGVSNLERTPREGSLQRRTPRRTPLEEREKESQERDRERHEQDVSQLSRRERIALLEGGCSDVGLADGAVGSSSSCPPRERPPREDSLRRRDVREDSTMRRREGREARGGERRIVSARDAAGATPESDRDPDEQLHDEDWYEQRRQNRAARLQKAVARPNGPQRDALDDLQQAVANAGSDVATEGSPNEGQLLKELAEISRYGTDSRCLRILASVSIGAHKLSSGGLVRAIETLAASDSTSASSSGSPVSAAEPASDEQKGAAALRSAAEALLVCLTPQLSTIGTTVLVDALRLMTAARVEEQTYLDMLLAQLLVALRRDRALFPPATLATIAGAIGTLHGHGLSAKRAGSGASSAANKRCLDAVGEMIIKDLENLSDDEIARLGGHFIVNFLDDVQRRGVLRRAAEREVGLRPGCIALLAPMKSVEQAVRQNSFAFIASLPDITKDYFTRLKGA